MGAFKPLLPFGPKTIIETCIDNLRGGGVEAVVVVRWRRDRKLTKLKAHLHERGVIFATNPDPESEMSASIASGVRALPKGIQAVIINPADHRGRAARSSRDAYQRMETWRATGEANLE